MATLNPHTGTLGVRRAAHLLRRTTFGPSKAEIDAFAAKTAQQAVDDLLAAGGFAMPPDPIDMQTNKTWVYGNDPGKNSQNTGTGNYLLIYYLAGWYLDEIFTRPSPHVAQKLVFWLHTNFTVGFQDFISQQLFNQIWLFRWGANRSLKLIARKIIMDNAMIRYLNSDSSNRWSPNENFPRELLELFTIGKGPQRGANDYTNYTEYDIQELARVFTGMKQENRWDNAANKDPQTGIPRGRLHTPHHDPSNKTFSAAFNNRTIVGGSSETDIHREFDQVIDMIFQQRATAERYVRRLYRFFVHHDITVEIERDIIQPLATDLAAPANNFNIVPVLSRLLKSQHFFDSGDQNPEDEVIGGMIKNPVELMLGIMRLFGITPPDRNNSPYEHHHRFYKDTLQNFFTSESDMEVFNPPSVAGYNAYHQAPAYSKSWISANTLPFRYKLIDMLLADQKLVTWGRFYAQLDVMQFANSGALSDPRDPYQVVRDFTDYAFPHALSASRMQYFLDEVLLNNNSSTYWANEWDSYQLTGDDTVVKARLTALIRAVCQSPEMQLL